MAGEESLVGGVQTTQRWTTTRRVIGLVLSTHCGSVAAYSCCGTASRQQVSLHYCSMQCNCCEVGWKRCVTPACREVAQPNFTHAVTLDYFVSKLMLGWPVMCCTTIAVSWLLHRTYPARLKSAFCKFLHEHRYYK